MTFPPFAALPPPSQVIEPLVSTQWFCSMNGMAKKGLDAVKSGETQIIPQRFEKVRCAIGVQA